MNHQYTIVAVGHFYAEVERRTQNNNKNSQTNHKKAEIINYFSFATSCNI